MKNALILIAILGLGFPLIAKEKIKIPAMKAVELSYDEFASYDVKLLNSSGKPVDVSVIDPNTKEQVSGFGLGPMGKVVLTVSTGNVLKLKNNTLKDITLSLDFVERKPQPKYDPTISRVRFTLHNSTAKSIPLIIPNVMNPNLSPFSNSGVELALGQKIFYKSGMKKTLLLTVDENIQEGQKVDVSKLIMELKKD